jgi:hypothetical protein
MPPTRVGEPKVRDDLVVQEAEAPRATPPAKADDDPPGKPAIAVDRADVGEPARGWSWLAGKLRDRLLPSVPEYRPTRVRQA